MKKRVVLLWMKMVMLFITLLIINILQVMQIIKFWVTTLRIGL